MFTTTSNNQSHRPEQLQYTLAETAAILGISVGMLKRDVRLGKISVKHWGRRILVSRDELLRIAALEHQPDGRSEVETAPAETQLSA
jgi:hypothetical protein